MSKNIRENTNTCILEFNSDTTQRFSFRKGDMLIHIRFTNIFNETPSIIDFWAFDDGQFATITNRIEDLPQWFQLHPTEVCGALVYKILEKFEKEQYPPEPIDASNIWRVRAGDRVIWIGDGRADIESQNGLLKLLTFSESALIIGGSSNENLDQFITFGCLSDTLNNKNKMVQTRSAINIIRGLGIPRAVDVKWYFG